MPIVTHTFKGPMSALEGVASDGTAKYITKIASWSGSVAISFRFPADIRVGRLPVPERYAAAVATIAAKRKLNRYVGK